MTQTNSDETDSVTNRSEIVFLYDAVNANPNGNPLSAENRPRVDSETQQAIVTDVRLKRYLRDQLQDDGHGILVRSPGDDEPYQTREQLLADRIKELDLDELLEDEDVTEQEIRDEVFGEFLAESADVRYFGATMAVDTDHEVGKYLPNNFTGPVQFSPGRSLNSVSINENYNSLTSVIANEEDAESGGFDLDDYRLKYALIGFHGLVDENNATNTRLTNEDVQRLDTLCWRAVKNQTITRSKVGQEPRFYLRVEYAKDNFHLGGLTHDLTLDEAESKPDKELRNIRDLVVDTQPLLDRLGDAVEQIETIHVAVSDQLQIRTSGGVGGEDEFIHALVDTVGANRVNQIDIYGTESA